MATARRIGSGGIHLSPRSCSPCTTTTGISVSVSSHRAALTRHSYRVVIISNQAGIKLRPDPKSKAPKALFTTRLANFKQKCSAILTQLDIPIAIYAATGRDTYRKPRTGIWKEICDDFDLEEDDADIEGSFYVGDAGGRLQEGTGKSAVTKDFSCSDRNFAHNLGIRFRTPEEFFLGEKPREFKRDFDVANYPLVELAEGPVFEKKNDKEVVIFCGPPGSGKSTFYWKHLKPLAYERINQDILKT
jgi:bifunctional polynucleotide phosphatase/kinase